MRYEYIMAILHYVRDNILPDNPNFQIHYSSGEPTITPYFDEIVDFWYENKINVVLYSNWSVYNQKFTNLSRDFGAKLYASLDAGTAKTFAQIKGVDCFDKVVDNLIRFSENGGHVRLKYMLLEDINDNKKEIMAFFAIAKRMKSPKIQLCSLFEKSLESAKPKTLEMLYLFLEECYVQGFSIPLLDLLHFTHFDKNNLDKRINELWGKQ
jgi:molybdenum cofactor biosynthesis enzyme MoaA